MLKFFSLFLLGPLTENSSMLVHLLGEEMCLVLPMLENFQLLFDLHLIFFVGKLSIMLSVSYHKRYHENKIIYIILITRH